MTMDIIKAIDEIAQKTPTAIAYDYLGKTNTYRELKNYSDALAGYIDGLNLTSGSPIMVYGDQTFSMIVAFLGCVKSGHAYIPVDQHSPKDRLTMIQNIAQPELVIAIQPLPVKLQAVKTIEIAKLEAIFRQSNQYPLTHSVKNNENFYIIFTSGTTGKPKGVQISHRNLLSFVNWLVSDFNVPERPVILSQAPYSFDLSVMDLYPTLVMGGTLQVLPKEVTDNFKSLFETLPKLALNVWVSTPSLIDICLLEPSFKQSKYPELSHFLFCGEELTHQTAVRLKQRFPDALIFNTYGPTETTVAVTAIEITNAILDKYQRLPIGYAKQDTTIKLDNLNAQNQAGEIIISGPSVSKGYLNSPQKTKQVFLGESQQFYHTGDLGTVDATGLVFYKGRIDFQIKLNGYRIELEEVNHYLNQQELIKSAVAVPKYNRQHKVTALNAYVVLQNNTSRPAFEVTKALKQQLRQEMMAYMIPQRFEYRSSLPLTINGKVDIKAMIKEANSND
ncbi:MULTISPECIES: D-alanine--poly(phosphoribitol) ligase subunit DltA [Loigolactobacillus]|uniref:D-alanine--D-alanyl carrier protein ligase n=1 Tax=Loigolactobacillus backii TaxID=375175 RepID=A0A192GZP3_9LACO|nr:MULTISPECIES: D-alanine--poly(phosphoribitol) ligase subunit DltA [Loigolactobacillus]ANK58828.1 D-alanine--poly(phosphoribitol) ligase [Loigolactobacillus backii]ANK61508.1 D-alanine--poly(phosphoribitol) ligase [Loigolactobacillus backii]ANK63818.1 D-alanine--poly(phosphoribitol) ligase [Loigolactobacillus backii]ANK66266.1 D-alanine--poly(phosphoribitol) ligase [Loigolactobacillus backii]ANK69294.1 D-alanine--poly(phosphoribitol) ligase [Loigolactobacillus backii]